MAPSSAKAKDGRFNFCDNSKIQTHQKKSTIRIWYWFLSMEKYTKKKPFFGNKLKMVRAKQNLISNFKGRSLKSP